MDNLLSCLFTALAVDGSLGQHIVANEIAHHVAVHSEELSECIGLRKLCVVVRILIVLDKLSHLGIEADVEVALTDKEREGDVLFLRQLQGLHSLYRHLHRILEERLHLVRVGEIEEWRSAVVCDEILALVLALIALRFTRLALLVEGFRVRRPRAFGAEIIAVAILHEEREDGLAAVAVV